MGLDHPCNPRCRTRLYVDGIVRRLASFDRTTLASAKAMVNRAVLPPDADLVTAYGEFLQSLTLPGFRPARPARRRSPLRRASTSSTGSASSSGSPINSADGDGTRQAASGQGGGSGTAPGIGRRTMATRSPSHGPACPRCHRHRRQPDRRPDTPPPARTRATPTPAPVSLAGAARTPTRLFVAPAKHGRGNPTASLRRMEGPRRCAALVCQSPVGLGVWRERRRRWR